MDGDLETRWASNAADGSAATETLRVDYGQVRTVDTLRLVWEAAYARQYVVYTSTMTQGPPWSAPIVVSDGDGGEDIIPLGDRQVRHVFIDLLERANPLWGYSLRELETYQSPPAVETFAPAESPAGPVAALTDAAQIAAAIQAHQGEILKDPNGNMVIARDKWIKYDAENRPVRIITADGTRTEMTYDHEGHRVKKTVIPGSDPGSSVSTIYVGDIYEVAGGIGTTYIFAGDQRIAMKTGSSIRYFHQDHLGSTSLMTDTAGTVVQTTRNNPFGGTYYSNGSVTDIGFTGHRMDDSAGLIYMKARYYDPAMGRFLTPDTIVQAPHDPQSLNRYSYVRNSPMNYVDPTGHVSWRINGKKIWETNVKTPAQKITDNLGNWWDNHIHDKLCSAPDDKCGGGSSSGGVNVPVGGFGGDPGQADPDSQPGQIHYNPYPQPPQPSILGPAGVVQGVSHGQSIAFSMPPTTGSIETELGATVSLAADATPTPWSYTIPAGHKEGVANALTFGGALYGLYQATTGLGQRIAEGSAKRFAAGNYAYGIPGVIASAWTPRTAPITGIILGSAAIGGGAYYGWSAIVANPGMAQAIRTAGAAALMRFMTASGPNNVVVRTIMKYIPALMDKK